MLVAGEAVEPRPLEERAERPQGHGREARPHVRRLRVARLRPRGPVEVVLAPALEVQLPAVPRDRPLHDLGGALVDRGDAHVAADLLDHVLAGVAVAAEGLDRVLGRLVPRLGRQVLGHRALGREVVLARVEPLRHPLDVVARGLEPHRVRDEQLVGVALLLAQRPAALDALLRVADGATQRLPARAEAEGRDHEARVAEDRLRLREALALDEADEPVGRDVDVLQEERGRVRGADAVLVLGLAVREALRPLVHEEPGRTAGSVGQDRVAVGDAAVADPLLAAGDPVADDLAVLLDRDGRGRERPEVAPGLGLGRAVGVEVAVLGQRPEPIGLLLGGRPDVDRVGAEEGGEDAGGDPEVDRGHGLGHPVDVVGPPAEAAELLRDGQQVEADLPRVVEVLHDLLGEVVAELDLQELGDREVLLRVLLERRQDLVQHLGVESRHEAPCVLFRTRRGPARVAEGRPRP